MTQRLLKTTLFEHHPIFFVMLPANPAITSTWHSRAAVDDLIVRSMISGKRRRAFGKARTNFKARARV